MKLLKPLAFLFAFALVAAACSSDDEETTTEDEAAESEASESEEMSDEEMSDEEMSDDEMSDEMEDGSHSDDAEFATVVDIAASNDDFSILVAAVTEAGLVEALSDPEAELTVFAPTNAAFEALLAELDITAEDLLAREDLGTILQNHVLGTKADAEAAIAAAEAGTPVETLAGTELTLEYGDSLTVGDATVVTPDLKAENGIVHVIDAVLLP